MGKRETKTIRPITMREPSGWVCYLFGGTEDGLVWRPLLNNEPNWFWRKMQYLILGNRWIREPNE